MTKINDNNAYTSTTECARIKAVEKRNAIDSIGPISASYWKAHDTGYVISYIGGEGNEEEKRKVQNDEKPCEQEELSATHPPELREKYDGK